jgi:NAD(P)H-flavin reductase|tara:strand:+ start:295 stop:987 length:693 start_codon:yes stop_codon:yes gene_type:complete
MWTKALFYSIEKVSKLTRKFHIKIEDNNFSYIAGQFIQIKINNLIRSYSIASYIENSNFVELIIVKLEGGAATSFLFDNVKEGDYLEVKGPLGKFVLPEIINNDIFFICTGTGIAPFRSMLQYIILKKINYQNIYLFFGTRTKKDLLYFDEMSNLKNFMNNFNYIPILSREKWAGNSGYVHEQYLNIIKNKSLNDPIFYLCGWKDMIKEARTNLKGLGFESKKIKLEIYG